MKKTIDLLIRLPYWYGVGIVIAYSILFAEFFSTLIHIALDNDFLANNLIVIFLKINYGIIILFGIVVWIVMTFMFHLTALLFDGQIQFKRFLYISAYPYIIPAIMILVGIFLLDGIEISGTEDAAMELTNNASFKLAMNLINLSFILYYIMIAILIRYVYNINFLKAAASVVIPIVSVWGITELFKLV